MGDVARGRDRNRAGGPARFAQEDGEDGALPGLARRLDASPGLRHDPVDDRESEACALASLLGREERLEDARERALVHARPRVAHDERDPAAGLERRPGSIRRDDLREALDRELAARGHGVARVDDEVEEHLLELGAVHLDRARARSEGGHELYVLADHPPEDELHVAYDRAQLDDRRREDLPPAEREELPREPRRVLERRGDVLEVLPALLVAREVAEEELRVALDDGQDVVEVVGDPSGEPPDRLHLLRLAELLLEELAVGDIDARADEAREGPIREEPRRAALEDRAPLAVGAPEPVEGLEGTPRLQGGAALRETALPVLRVDAPRPALAGLVLEPASREGEPGLADVLERAVRAREPDHDGGAVGHRPEARLALAERLLRRPAPGEVVDLPDDVEGRAVLAADDRERQLRVQDAPVPVAVSLLEEGVRCRALRERPHERRADRVVLGDRELVEVVPDELAVGVAEELAERAVHAQEDPVETGQRAAHVRVLEGRAEPLLALAELAGTAVHEGAEAPPPEERGPDRAQGDGERDREAAEPCGERRRGVSLVEEPVDRGPRRDEADLGVRVRDALPAAAVGVADLYDLRVHEPPDLRGLGLEVLPREAAGAAALLLVEEVDHRVGVLEGLLPAADARPAECGDALRVLADLGLRREERVAVEVDPVAQGLDHARLDPAPSQLVGLVGDVREPRVQLARDERLHLPVRVHDAQLLGRDPLVEQHREDLGVALSAAQGDGPTDQVRRRVDPRGRRRDDAAGRVLEDRGEEDERLAPGASDRDVRLAGAEVRFAREDPIEGRQVGALRGTDLHIEALGPVIAALEGGVVPCELELGRVAELEDDLLRRVPGGTSRERSRARGDEHRPRQKRGPRRGPAPIHAADTTRKRAGHRLFRGPSLKERFRYPRITEFEPSEHFEGTFGVFVPPSGARKKTEVELVFKNERWLKLYIRERRWHRSQELTDLPDGRLRLKLRVNNMVEVLPWIRSFGRDVKVVKPARSKP